ncbi:Deoxyadenosine kinase-like [Oopsacas minuta]|uniref:Cilia- and flagella-associated protein 36 n=1 Tax=Oopsacas minuta TaxID=111878 RepID=A0AAV7KD76_9METZ|nr:Deoxyadenosine kinase-like [Oopsacas minuta]
MSLPCFNEPVIDNAYLADFYKDPKRYSFPLQVYLLNRRFQQHQQIIWQGQGGVQDRTIYEDSVFAKVLKDDGLMEEREYHTYRSLFSNMSNFMKKPNLIIHLDVRPEESKRRIEARSRDCESGITLDYLQRLYIAYESFIEDISRIIPVIRVNYDKFRTADEMVEMIIREYSQMANMNIFKPKESKLQDWVIDSVIQYICSSLFSEPILQFIEDRCLVFDSSEENKFSYTEVHQDYGKLIDSQLGKFMNDTGIHPNDFASALSLDINEHQGVNKLALKNAFKHIEAVDNFLKFKDTMVQKNIELNNSAMDILERYGMLTPSSRQQQQAMSSNPSDIRNIDTPPPPYPEQEEYQEDTIRPKQLISFEAVETFVTQLSTDPQQFDNEVREQQEAIKCNIGVELEDSRLQIDQLNLFEHTDKPIQQNKLYPTLDQSEIEPFAPTAPNEEISYQQEKVESVKNISEDFDFFIETENQTKVPDKSIPPISTEKLTSQVLPKIHSTQQQQQQYTDHFPEKHIDMLNEEKELLSDITAEDNRVQSPVEAADSLTSQWVEYARDQQSIWKSSKKIAPIGKSEPSKEDLALREDHFKRQRDLLRNKRKPDKDQQPEQIASPQNIPLVSDSSTSTLQEDEKNRAMAEDAKRFRRALSAKLKKEVIDKHR